MILNEQSAKVIQVSDYLALPLFLLNGRGRGQEQLIVVSEVKGIKNENEWRPLFENIRECISKNFGIKIYEIVYLF
ncbi:hypothetical protein [Candidatus Coxiella mudrowiae]|uniref:hypothetical protein n=1 Tax=Candidatus Coxiella mudrowiae TaxID=2054173 RepID=UPI001FD0AA7B|nr:hypothetical protein [Candidatus Coxiella mudrowiae]